MVRLFVLLIAFSGLSACAGTTFHDPACSDKKCKKDIGLHYYPPVPHLLVTRPQNKEGATTTSIIYIPDTNNPMSMKFRPGFGKGVMAVSLSNGMVTSFNQETDPKVAELLGSITAPITGLATADATRASGELTRAQAADLLKTAAASTPTVAAFQYYKDNQHDPLMDINVENWRCRNPQGIDHPNPYLNGNQIATIQKAAGKLACAADRLRTLNDGDQADEFMLLVDGLDGLSTASFASTDEARLVRLVHRGSLEASVIKAVIAPYKSYTPGNGDAQQTIAGFVNEALTLLSQVADELSPPQSSVPNDPFELYRIEIPGGYLTRIK